MRVLESSESFQKSPNKVNNKITDYGDNIKFPRKSVCNPQ